MVPLFVVLFGVDFLLGSLGALSWGFVNLSWPILVILAGGQKMFSGMCKCCNGGVCKCC